ncbi:sigma-70 family RNA polymerase sigma factor [Aeromicrobium chenweiae]|uniref:Uncharacterized protein n=1 Tax=Aeromicrobium chenweiae TaxID=2079793 RepID=A0A2S0WMP9_9ACTN|nr:sigma-70 family RNA polymerase sigma factor [Aeromicrobium chenweiae]AWB92587.1 hypothetical protein C3E78_10460 [Aeromicrobium chenweiae]TGN33575.1 sigma-70 family RNA polymerase sigma factor [Aeromicrobium chenweiae]
MAEHDLVRALDLDMTLDDLEDGALVELTRQGSNEAYAVLYDRYVYSARRLARHLGQREESDDVVADAFAQILGLLQRGKGPDSAFRAYLFTAIRHECGRRAKAVKRVVPTDDDTVIDSAVPFGAGDLDDFEKTAVRAAYESLPERWRTVLWHLDVEGRKPNELADALGLKPNSVSALVYRARAGLRDAYLQQHVSADDESGGRSCQVVREHLAAVVRRTATRREQEKVHAHLETCEACMAVYLDLQEVNREVGATGAPVALGVVAGGGVALAVSSGATAQLLAAAKGALVAVAAPATAAVATGAAVLAVSVPSGWPSQPTATDDRAAAVPTRPAPAGVGASRAAAAPTVDSATVLPLRARVATSARAVAPAPATSVPAPSGVAPTAPSVARTTPSVAPSVPATDGAKPVSSPGLDVGVAKVAAGSRRLDVSVGPVALSTQDVTDRLREAAPRTTRVLETVLGVAGE